jgi:hypothetical protein
MKGDPVHFCDIVLPHSQVPGEIQSRTFAGGEMPKHL